jgi:hypothetical protein
LRGERKLLVALPQHPEKAPHLGERLDPACFDRVEGFPCLFRLRRERAPSAARLNDDDADRVCDDIVELARDPNSLLRDRRASPLLALALRRQRPRLEVPLAEPAMADRATGQPRPADDEEEEEVAAGIRAFGVWAPIE